jgi:hypothetical protein
VKGAAAGAAIGERLRLAADVVVALMERLVRPASQADAPDAGRRHHARARRRFFRDLGDDARDLLLLALVDGRGGGGESPRSSAWRRSWVVRNLLDDWPAQAGGGGEAAPRCVGGCDGTFRPDRRDHWWARCWPARARPRIWVWCALATTPSRTLTRPERASRVRGTSFEGVSLMRLCRVIAVLLVAILVPALAMAAPAGKVVIAQGVDPPRSTP